MQLERRVLGNAASLSMSALISQLANFGFVILVARGFGRDIFAQYALSMAIGGLICTVVSFGSISLLIRSSAQNRSHGLDMLGVVLPVQAVLGISIFATTIAGGFFSNMSFENLCILASIVAHHTIIRITAVIVTPLQGMERMDVVAVLRIARSLITLIAALSIALTTSNAVLAVASMPVISFVFLVVAGGIVGRWLGSIYLRWDRKATCLIAIQSFPFFITALLSTASDRIGILMLGGLHGSDGIATYASGERVVTAASVLYSALTGAALPAASRLIPDHRERHIEVVNRIVRIVILLMLPVAALLFLFSGDIIALLFGQEFVSSVPILKVMAFALSIRALASVQIMVATSIGQQRDVLIGRIAALVLLVSAGLLLIRSLGPLGLAYAVLAAELVQAIVLYILLRRAGILISPVRLAGATTTACALTIALGTLLLDAGLVTRVILLVPCMIASLWGLGAVRGHDIKYFFSILRTDQSDYSGST